MLPHWLLLGQDFGMIMKKIDAIHEIELVIKPDPERVAKYNQLLENFVTVSDTLSDLGDLFKQRAEKQVSAVK